MATAGKGLPFIGKMNEFLDRVLHPTVQKVGHSRAALDVIQRGYYLLSAVNYIVEAGSDDNLVKVTAHGFKPGDLVRLVVTANTISEFEIIIHEVVDADNFKLAGYLSASLTTGDTFQCLRPISERVASDGSSLATVTSPPIQYNRKTGGITTATTVLEDLDTPSLSRGMPVVIHGLDAASITVTGDQLNISSSHANDSMRLGDGTTLTGVTLNNELKVKDTDASTQLTTLNAKDFATAAKQDTLLAELQLKADLTETQPVSIAGTVAVSGPLTDVQLRATAVPVSGPLTDTQLRATPVPVSGSVTSIGGATEAKQDTQITRLNLLATEAKQDAEAVLVGAINETAPATDTGSSGLNGRLQRIAQRLTSLIALFPVSIGQKVMTGSLSVTMASDQGNIPIVQGALAPVYNQSLVVANTGVTTLIAPAGAKGAKVMTSGDNASNLRITLDGITAPSATVGFQMQAGRSEDFGSCGNLQVIAESVATNQQIFVHWSV